MGIGPDSLQSDNGLPSLVVDAEGQIASFVATTLRVCHQLVVLTYWTLLLLS